MIVHDGGVQVRRHDGQLAREIDLDSREILVPEWQATGECTDACFANRALREGRRRKRDPLDILDGAAGSTRFDQWIVALCLRARKLRAPRLRYERVAAVAIEAARNLHRHIEGHVCAPGGGDIDERPLGRARDADAPAGGFSWRD